MLNSRLVELKQNVAYQKEKRQQPKKFSRLQLIKQGRDRGGLPPVTKPPKAKSKKVSLSTLADG